MIDQIDDTVRKFRRFLHNSPVRRFVQRVIKPVIWFNPLQIVRMMRYAHSAFNYRRAGGTVDVYWPILGDGGAITSVEPHYFYQGIWAARHIFAVSPIKHVDVGSLVSWVGLLSTTVDVEFVDIRPPNIQSPRLSLVGGSILSLPYSDSSVPSLSCMHVLEHIGLGRYGDPLDPSGTEKASAELVRVLSSNGMLYVSVPIGVERTEFNAQRVLSPDSILKLFSKLKLIEFSAVDDEGTFHKDADISQFRTAQYACGMFRFTKA